MTITGKIRAIFPAENFGKLDKREFVVDYIIPDSKSQKVNPILFTMINKVKVLDGFDVGDEVEVMFAINGRKSNTTEKYYNNLNCIFIKKIIEE